MKSTAELAEAIASFRFDALSPESKTGLVALYTDVFLKPFDIGCGACYHDAWQKLLKWKRNQVKDNSEIKKQFMIETKYRFKKGYPKGGKVTIRANGELINVTPENLNDFLAETLLNSPYKDLIEVVEITEKKSVEPFVLKVKPIVSTSTEQPKDGSEQSENVKEQDLPLNDFQQSKEATNEAEQTHANEATATVSKKRGRPAKVTA
jgi:hypothetical protein